MQALSDEQRMEALESKIDKGFAEMRTEMRAEFKTVRSELKGTERELRTAIMSARGEARSDFRTLIAVSIAMWVTTILPILGVFLQHTV